MSNSTLPASREYFMPKRKERMAGYIRESDERLAESTTIDSAAKAVREYGEKQGYIYDVVHEYREAIGAYSVPYFQRSELMKALKAAERREFDVFVITEVRALSRKGAGEVFIIYEMLQKYGVRLETIHERFSDDPAGERVLSFEATYAKLEREQSYLRLQRGKADRIAIGKAPNGHHAAYGLILIDTAREVKGQYAFDPEFVYTDENGEDWNRYRVCMFIFDLHKNGGSLHGIASRLNDMGILSPRGGHWTPATLMRLVKNPIYMGEVWANRYVQVETEKSKKAKHEQGEN